MGLSSGLLFLLVSTCAFAQWDDSLLKPFVMDHRRGGSSLADVSFLLDPPAGKDGFISHPGRPFRPARRPAHSFLGRAPHRLEPGLHPAAPERRCLDVRGHPGALRRRIWSGCTSSIWPRRAASSTPRSTDSRSFDRDQLDRLDFLIAELKKRGIYVDLNLNVGRSYKAGDGVRDFDKIRWGKGLTLFDPRLIELQKEYAKNLLTHVNPYTRTEYRNEPAIAIVEILNENAHLSRFPARPRRTTRMSSPDCTTNGCGRREAPAQLRTLREVASVARAQQSLG